MRPRPLRALIWTTMLALQLFTPSSGPAQEWTPAVSGVERDPCGLPDTNGAGYRLAALMNWGYGYDSLRADLQRWGSSPYARIDSIGSSVQGRALYQLTIESPSIPSAPRKRVWVHARTHPNEVQGTWVTNEMISILLGESPLGQRLRDSCLFNIVPMYNPDGVELSLSRQNAHNIDIESNWNVVPGEPEVQALRARFVQLMAEPNPILVALNIHSSVSCARYFVYHENVGTSPLFGTLQQGFIGGVRAAFPGGIEPHTYFTSWKTYPPPTQYPESWFWYNHRESVLALTYEDKNCAANGGYDSTAYALLKGTGDFLGVTSGLNGVEPEEMPTAMELQQNFPNPFNPSTTVAFTIAETRFTTLKVFDLLGREVATLVDELKPPGSYRARFDAPGLASGIYFCRMTAGPFSQTRRMVLSR